MDDTMVMLYSDHGHHMQALFYMLKTDNVLIEDSLPGMLISLPEIMNKRYRKNISQNQQSVVSAVNIYDFLMHIVMGDEYSGRKGSLLSSSSEQTCDSLKIDE